MEEKYKKIINRLKELSELGAGWDGFGCMPVNPKLIDFLRSILNGPLGYEIFDNWRIFPDQSGWIQLSYDFNNIVAGVLLMDSKFNYFIKSGNMFEKEEGLELTEENVEFILYKCYEKGVRRF